MLNMRAGAKRMSKLLCSIYHSFTAGGDVLAIEGLLFLRLDDVIGDRFKICCYVTQ